MNFGGTVVQIKLNTQIKKRAGGTYVGYQLVYNNEAGELKTLEKAMASLKFTPSVADTLNNLAAGDEFNGTMEKDGQFWNVTSLSKGSFVGDVAVEKPAQAKNDSIGSSGARAKTVGRSDPVQKMIVRQNSLSNAVAYVGNGHNATVDEVIAIAEQFETWVFRGLE